MNRQNSPLPKTIPIKHTSSFKEASIKTLKKLASSSGLNNISIAIFSQWPQIMQGDFFEVIPEKITYTAGNNHSGTLYIRTYRTTLHKIQHETEKLRTKINMFFGRNVIHRIVISDQYLKESDLNTTKKINK